MRVDPLARLCNSGLRIPVLHRGSREYRRWVELAPIPVNTISPRDIDTGAWDWFGEDGKRNYFEHISSSNPARRIGTTDEVAGAVLFAMTNSFLTGVTLKIDGGEPLT